MFIGMCFGLVMHFAALYFRLPFPGYYWPEDEEEEDDDDVEQNGNNKGERQPLVQKQTSDVSSADVTIPTWMYFFLAIPSLFDTLATLLCMMGLRYVDVSIYQMLRGSGIIFVALMKQHGKLDRKKYISVSYWFPLALLTFLVRTLWFQHSAEGPPLQIPMGWCGR